KGMVTNPFFTFEAGKHEASIGSACVNYFLFLAPLVAIMFCVLTASGDLIGLVSFAGWLSLGLILIALAGFIGFGIVKIFDSLEIQWGQVAAVATMVFIYFIAGVLFVTMPQWFDTQNKTTLYFVSLLFRLILFIAASAGVSFAISRAFGGSGSFEQHFQGIGLLFSAFAIIGAFLIMPLFSFLFVNYADGGLEFTVTNFGYAAVLGFELATGLSLLFFGSFIASSAMHKEAVDLLGVLVNGGNPAVAIIAVLIALAFAVVAGRACFAFFKSIHGLSPQRTIGTIVVSTVFYAIVLYALIFTGIVKL
ncbi:MAG: hypothetical protein V1811_02585, partial [Candidatus Micrarchaeota archaeon]